MPAGGYCGQALAVDAGQPYDLVVAAADLESPRLAPLWALLRSDRFQASIRELGGYGITDLGRRIR